MHRSPLAGGVEVFVSPLLHGVLVAETMSGVLAAAALYGTETDRARCSRLRGSARRHGERVAVLHPPLVVLAAPSAGDDEAVATVD